MSTLQRLEDAEKAISEFKGLAGLTARLPKMEQDLANVITSVGQLVNYLDQKLGQQDQMLQTVANQNVALEQSIIQLGRTLAAVSGELSETHGLSSANVSARMRKADDDTEQARIQNMLKYKALTLSEVVNEKSTVVFTENFKAKTEAANEEDKKMYDYRVLEMVSQYNDKQVVADFLGKKVGETVTVETEGGTYTLTIKEIYDYAEKIEANAEAEASATT